MGVEMKNWKRRLKLAWRVLWGWQVSLTDGRTQRIYVQDPGPPGKLISLTYYQGGLLGLTADGSLYRVEINPMGWPEFTILQKGELHR